MNSKTNCTKYKQYKDTLKNEVYKFIYGNLMLQIILASDTKLFRNT